MNKVSLNRRQAVAWCTGLVTSAVTSSHAQTWPSRPVRIVVPYPAGGSSDLIARLVSNRLSEELGQPVVVENKAGANGNIGAAAVADAKDGHTMLLCDVGALAISTSVYTKLTFDPASDLRGVAMLAYSPHMLVVHPSVSANTLTELVNLSKVSPLNFAATSIASPPHLAGLAIQQATGANWQYINYRGGAQAISDTIAGQTQVLMNGMLATLPHVQSGKLKVIAISKRTRMGLAPQVPTVAESGVRDFESGTWQGVLMPASTPSHVVEKVNAALTKIIRDPDIRSKLTAQGAEVNTMSVKEFSNFFASEQKRWEAVVKRVGIKID